MEIEVVDIEKVLHPAPTSTTPKGQIVEQADQSINDETPEDTKYLSQHNQKVEKETRSINTGKFKNSDNSPEGPEKTMNQKFATANPANNPNPKEAIQETNNQEVEKNEPSLNSNGDLSVGRLQDFAPKFRDLAGRLAAKEKQQEDQKTQVGGQGPSATDDHLENVQQASQTLLSTREFVYYAYYNRIKEKLRQYWEPKIKEKVERIFRQGRTIASSDDRKTSIIIILDRSGTLVKVQVIGESGIRDLDDAAVEAFRAAAPFPNPPKGIVDPAEGTIKIRWDFVLEA